MTGQQISALELQSVMTRGLEQSLIVDVRTPDEFAKGAIAGAKNIPVSEILSHVEELRRYEHIYLYCLSGSRSELAALQLEASGLSGCVYSLTSGLLAWRAAGFITQ